MADRGGLKLLGFIFATVTLAVMLATGMVVDATGSFQLALWMGAAVMVLGAVLYTFGVKDPIPLEGLEPESIPQLASAV